MIGMAITKKTGREGKALAKKKWVDDPTGVSSANISEVVDKVRDDLLV